MSYQNLLLEIKNKKAIVTINRPDKLNALNAQTINELEVAFKELCNNDEVYAVIVTGSGEKAFVAGADITELNKLDVLGAKEFSERGNSVFSLIENFDKPVIAAVNGFALGGGCELALACHIRLAGDNAKFGQPEVNLGIIPGYGGTQRLPRIVGMGWAMEMIITGKFVSAQEAYRIGLANEVVPKGQSLQRAKELARQIAKLPQGAMRTDKQAALMGYGRPLEEGLRIEAEVGQTVLDGFDIVEGASAFIQKRKPGFKQDS
ncbi:enoyl-CoA hydratase [Candidatus Parcubacteria bacterium]|nr:MAG: enoyl-CoA hydratase [Candidatus Parcubacteria bacterium]